VSKLTFKIEQTDENARAGVLQFQGLESVPTPVFMPVGTQATVKSMKQEELEEIGYRLILANTYHLYLRPGEEVMNHFGGVKKFMSWPHAVLTDSGGFQAFSLSDLSKYTEQGVSFKSHIDGSSHMFTPQRVMEIQKALGSDIIMPIDDCAPFPADSNRLKESLKRTHDWFDLTYRYWNDSGMVETQNLFSIVQGGTDPELRKISARVLREFDVPGHAIGGLSVGETTDLFVPALKAATEELPVEKPRYLMGVGTIPEIIHAVDAGVDMMDCVLPTRNARNGQVFTSAGKLNLRNLSNQLDDRPMDETCSCSVCQRYSRGYIRHLHKTNELLAYSLSTYHNLHFMKRFMEGMREAIMTASFTEFKLHWLAIYGQASR